MKSDDPTQSVGIEAALHVFAPEHWGFMKRSNVAPSNLGRVWVKHFPQIGEVCFAPLSWQHGDQKMLWERENELPKKPFEYSYPLEYRYQPNIQNE
jgi:hypothetical protein